MCPALFHARRSKYMSKLQQLTLGALATGLIAVGSPPRPAPFRPPRDRPSDSPRVRSDEEPASSPSPIETPSPSRWRTRRSQAATKHKKPLGPAPLHELKPKRPLTQRCPAVTLWSSGDVTFTIEFVLHVQLEHAADAAVRTHGLRHVLP